MKNSFAVFVLMLTDTCSLVINTPLSSNRYACKQFASCKIC